MQRAAECTSISRATRGVHAARCARRSPVIYERGVGEGARPGASDVGDDGTSLRVAAAAFTAHTAPSSKPAAPRRSHGQWCRAGVSGRVPASAQAPRTRQRAGFLKEPTWFVSGATPGCASWLLQALESYRPGQRGVGGRGGVEGLEHGKPPHGDGGVLGRENSHPSLMEETQSDVGS